MWSCSGALHVLVLPQLWKGREGWRRRSESRKLTDASSLRTFTALRSFCFPESCRHRLVGWAAKTGRSVALSSSYKILGFPTRFHHRRCSCNFLALHKREEAEEGRRRRRLSYTILMAGLQVRELSTLVQRRTKRHVNLAKQDPG